MILTHIILLDSLFTEVSHNKKTSKSLDCHYNPDNMDIIFAANEIQIIKSDNTLIIEIYDDFDERLILKLLKDKETIKDIDKICLVFDYTINYEKVDHEKLIKVINRILIRLQKDKSYLTRIIKDKTIIDDAARVIASSKSDKSIIERLEEGLDNIRKFATKFGYNIKSFIDKVVTSIF